MREIKSMKKKSMIGPVISVFVMVLVVSILAGLAFLFVSELKSEVVDTTSTSSTATNETGAYINGTGYHLVKYVERGFANPSVVAVVNNSGSGLLLVASGNYTIVGEYLYNSTSKTYNDVNITYTYTSVTAADASAYDAVNKTEEAGASIVDYLSLIFLAVIFGAILTLVLKIILPYINLGKQMDGF